MAEQTSSLETQPLPSVRRSTADFPAGEGWDICREQIGEVFDVALESSESAAARVDVELTQLDQLLFGAIGLAGPRLRGVRSARKARLSSMTMSSNSIRMAATRERPPRAASRQGSHDQRHRPGPAAHGEFERCAFPYADGAADAARRASAGGR